jgi:hypothetical protein
MNLSSDGIDAGVVLFLYGSNALGVTIKKEMSEYTVFDKFCAARLAVLLGESLLDKIECKIETVISEEQTPSGFAELSYRFSGSERTVENKNTKSELSNES